MAYDFSAPAMRKAMDRSIGRLIGIGIPRSKIIVYVLYNFTDTPDGFFERVRDLLNWGAVAYPMRFEPLDCLEKNKHIAKGWTQQHLEMVAKARRAIGYGGAFPAYKGLKEKFNAASNFLEAFCLRSHPRGKPLPGYYDEELFQMGGDHQFPTQALAPLPQV